MKDLIVWLLHTPAGTIGLVAATVAMSTNKGSRLHRKAGKCFTIAMLLMLITGFVAALLKESTDDMFLSAVVIYTVFTAWLTAHHKKNETGLLEYVALIWIVAIAIAAFFISAGWGGGVIAPNAYLFWAGFAVLCAIGDVRNLFRSGLSGIQRVIRHIWRIGFSLIWAALAFTDKVVKMLGSNIKELPEEQLLYIVAVPTMIILITILFWIINVLFFSRRKFASYGT
tara:strand:- start:144 stop:824 length:681 start_codon:yes stop_codon:yes gene_type:complete